MKVIKCNLPDFKEISILPLADIHLGDPHSDFKKLMEYIDYLKNTPNAFTVLNGDLMDSATRNSIGDIYAADLSPMRQLEQCVKIFGPIKDKILACTGGNHEARIYRSDGIDTSALMCNQLGLDCYAPTGALLFVRFGKQSKHKHNRPVCYTIYAQHGRGGGKTEGGKINRVSDLAAIVDADIYLHSHTHLPALYKLGYFRVDPQNSSVDEVTKLFVNTSGMLNYGGYGETMGYKPASTDTPLIRLDGTRKRMTAAL